ncbi:hypothetical protein [Nocardioides sp.]|uniref:NPCBM/NEW2 domain-containing protein n=1 Tax=Nocardioides sp. TaxID=35761 RepID=UPI00271729FB|nr:hypothetical protein [Nocardioides sp.]MDO9457481.1 hypothetical protein [Nocardioides sp.]
MRSLTRALLVPTVLAAVAAGASLTTGVSATAADAPDRSAVASARAGKYTATIKASRVSLDVGERLVLSGKVAPAKRGTVVKLQKRLEGRTWVAEATLRTTASGAYSYNDRPTTAGKRTYRVVVPATPGRAKGTSKPVAVTLFRWQDLTLVKSRAGSATRVTTSIAVNGATYARGLAGYTSYDEGFVDWNFARRCTSLRARFGNGDESADTATANIQLVVDGTPVFTDSFGLTESTVQTINVTNAFRVAFKWTSSNVTGTPENQSGAEAVMAVPLVRCSF